MKLHGFFRSGASWRVRIALALKGIDYDQVSYKLREKEQNSPEFLAMNPQGLVPALELDNGDALTQSLAIIEYLDETHPQPALLPTDPALRAKVRAAAYAIACDTHPVQNLKILLRVEEFAGEGRSKEWARIVIEEGLSAFAKLIDRYEGPYSFGSAPSLADLCLIPQLGNARRFGAKWDYGRIPAIERQCMDHPAFASTKPELQPDAE